MRAQRARRRARARRGRVHREGRDDRRRSPPRCGAGAVEPGSFPRLRALPRARGRRLEARARRRPRVPPRPGRRRGGVRAVRRGRSAPRRLAAPAPRAARRDRARGADAVPSRSRRVPRGFLRRSVPRRRARVARHDVPRKLRGGQPHVRVRETRASFARVLPPRRGRARARPRRRRRVRRRRRGRGGCGGGGGFRTRGKTFVVGDDERRRRRVEPSRRVAMDASLRESSRIRIQFHEVGRRPRASRPLPRGRREEPPTKKIGAPRVAPRGDAPRANRRRAPAPVHGLGLGSRSAFGRDP